MRRGTIVVIAIASLVWVRDIRAQVSREEVCRELAAADGTGLCSITNDRGMTDEEFKEFVSSQLELTEGAAIGEVTMENGIANVTLVATSGMEVIGTLPVEDVGAAWGAGAAAAGLGLGAAGLGLGLGLGLDDDSSSSEAGVGGPPGTPPGQGTPGGPTRTPPRRGTPGPPATPPGQGTPGPPATPPGQGTPGPPVTPTPPVASGLE